MFCVLQPASYCCCQWSGQSCAGIRYESYLVRNCFRKCSARLSALHAIHTTDTGADVSSNFSKFHACRNLHQKHFGITPLPQVPPESRQARPLQCRPQQRPRSEGQRRQGCRPAEQCPLLPQRMAKLCRHLHRWNVRPALRPPGLLRHPPEDPLRS
jgi:hypothetical protein